MNGTGIQAGSSPQKPSGHASGWLFASAFSHPGGYPSLATAALIAWEWLQRERDIFATFDVTHYRPKERPNAVRVLHVKTGEENWIPLFDENGVPLYPELMAELDAIQARAHRRPDAAARLGRARPVADRPTLTRSISRHMSRKVKEVIRAAGLAMS